MKIAEKVVVSRSPETVEINLAAVPKHETDALCRVLIRSVTEAFKNPKVAADYKLWLAAKYNGQQQTT